MPNFITFKFKWYPFFVFVILSLVPTVPFFNAQAEVSNAVTPVTADDFFILGKAWANLDSPGTNGLKEAIQNYTQAIRLKPDFAAAYYERGRAYFERGDFSEAMENYTQAIRINPKYVLAYYRRGLLYSKSGNLQKSVEDYTQAIRVDPNFAIAYYQRGFVESQLESKEGAVEDYVQAIHLASIGRNKKLEEAISNYYSVFQSNPNFANTYYRSVSGLFLRETFLRLFQFYSKESQEGLLNDLTQAIQLNPNFADTYYYRGLARQKPIPRELDDLYLFSKDRQEAIADYTHAIQLKPGFTAAYFERGRAREEEGDILGAIQDQTQTLRLAPNFATSYYRRGFLYSKLGLQQEAVKDLIQALRIDFDNKNNYSKSTQQRMQVLEAYPINAETYYKRGQVRSALGDYQGAIWDYTQAIRLESNFTDAYFRRGQAYCEEVQSIYADNQEALKNVERAIADFTHVIQLKPNDASVYYYRGYACGNLTFWRQGQNKQKAIADLNRAIQLKPDYAEAYYWRGYAYYDYACDSGDPKKANGDYLQTIRLVGRLTFNANNEFVATVKSPAPNNETIHSNSQRGSFYLLRGFNHLMNGSREAITDFTKVIQLDPKDSDAYYGRGFAYYKVKDYLNAVKDLTQALQLNPENSDAYLIRALAFYDSGDKQKALGDAIRAIRIAPDFPEAYFVRDHIRRGWGSYLGWPHRSHCGGEPFPQANPSDFYNRGRFLARRGDNQEALKNLQQAATLFYVRGEMKRYQETQNLIRQLKQ